MEKYDVLQKMLIRPKKLELKDSVCAFSPAAVAKTNCTEDFSYLLGMLGIAAPKCDAKSCEEFFYLTVGDAALKPSYLGFFWWKWDELQHREHYYADPAGDQGFTIQGKPAEVVFRRWAKRAKEENTFGK